MLLRRRLSSVRGGRWKKKGEKDVRSARKGKSHRQPGRQTRQAGQVARQGRQPGRQAGRQQGRQSTTGEKKKSRNWRHHFFSLSFQPNISFHWYAVYFIVIRKYSDTKMSSKQEAIFTENEIGITTLWSQLGEIKTMVIHRLWLAMYKRPVSCITRLGVTKIHQELKWHIGEASVPI
jgi:hypothetical protein